MGCSLGFRASEPCSSCGENTRNSQPRRPGIADMLGTLRPPVRGSGRGLAVLLERYRKYAAAERASLWENRSRGYDRSCSREHSTYLSGHAHGSCAAYCTASPVNLKLVAQFFAQPSLHDVKRLAGQTEAFSVAKDVVRVPFETDRGTGQAFFFSSGACVFWGLPLTLRSQLFGVISRLSQDESKKDKRYGTASRLAFAESSFHEFDHDFAYVLDDAYAGERAAFRHDRIFVKDLNSTFELLAISYGLAQSVKLHNAEVALDALVQRTEKLPVELAENGAISMPARDIRKLIGELLSARYNVNLVSDILDTPEFFWAKPELERLYLECCAAVELRPRSRILNTRAEIVKDALSVLNSELAESASMRVERAILVLIGVEVLFEVIRFTNVGWS